MAAPAPKIIIVGGGPVGMTAVHALTRAGIDFVLLESRPTIVMDAGSNLVLSLTGLRALSQFGILPALEKCSSALAKFSRIDHQARDIGDTMFFTYFQQNFGGYPRVISRHDLMKTLWEALPADAQAKVHANKKVSDIRSTDNGVIVECADGTSYEGSVVIGADGTYSTVRKHMSALVPKEAEQTKTNGEGPFLTSYRCFWLRFSVLPGIQPGDASETHGPDATIQVFAGDDSAVAGVYEKLPEPTHKPQRYKPEDEEAFVEKWGHLPLVEGGSITLADAYKAKHQSGLVNLEEGVIQCWSSAGRAVLVGDAAHKFTPSTGAGCNNGIIDVVVLANKLNKLFSGGAAPSRDDLDAAFAEYQTERREVVTSACKLSGGATSMASWSSGFLKFLDLYVFSSQMVQKLFVNMNKSAVARMPIFDFVEGEEKLVGAVPWVNAIPSPKAQAV
ncbi:hypothetical protein PgNI_05415 [Pyricularia grisea]|uniref:FAD-binding domain-containing protein n=1 Tax=Pyricularia grisea TaxID=148305 RepID=A0A6P8B4B4_PYRGI|nr:hypothetical protein PgNI_05415 [Pyricularia grisea]TLD09974.1 hypothetical protein PgNI_05415 [Pyricularia grisea]